MMIDSDFVAYVVEQLKPLGAVTARKMFGGYGIFRATKPGYTKID